MKRKTGILLHCEFVKENVRIYNRLSHLDLDILGEFQLYSKTIVYKITE